MQGKAGHTQRSATGRWGRLLLGLLRLFMVVLFMAPIAWIGLAAFKSPLQIASSPPLLVFRPTLENFRQVLLDDNFGAHFRDSAIVSVSTTLIALVLGTLAAYGIVRLRAGGERLLFWVLSMRMLPPVAAVLPVYLLMRDVSLLDTYTGLIIVYILVALPFAVWLMASFIAEVPQDIDEAAALDGCGHWGILWHVIIPLTRPGLLATAIFSLIALWNEFLFALALTRESVKTLPVAIAGYISDRAIYWGPMAAVTVLAALPIVIFTVLLQRHLVRGLTYGALR
jgi:multiple sugar transport system permease protein